MIFINIYFDMFFIQKELNDKGAETEKISTFEKKNLRPQT